MDASIKSRCIEVDDLELQCSNSKSREEHEQHLKTTLQVLRDRKLYAKFSKFEFWIGRVTFLGHIVSKEGVEVDPSKVESFKQWQVPKMVMEIRSFLGLTGYYHKFIKGFSSIVVPLTSLMKKNAKFI
ncbi:putative mitochondrial protein AtMg00860 [Primulina tabacum]|uniref:putative mitochondrial protein AtMg00860 n=1 Tax=Primulina tabacum TaxID=48773 RepID=UPI003F59E2CC